VEYRRHGVHDENPSNLPPGYTLDLAGDPCVIVLRRAGDGVVTRFTRNVDPEEIRRTAQEDRTQNESLATSTTETPRSRRNLRTSP
jgi:hypothetical protein